MIIKQPTDQFFFWQMSTQEARKTIFILEQSLRQEC